MVDEQLLQKRRCTINETGPDPNQTPQKKLTSSNCGKHGIVSFLHVAYVPMTCQGISISTTDVAIDGVIMGDARTIIYWLL